MQVGGKILHRTPAQHDLLGAEFDLRRNWNLRDRGRKRAPARQQSNRIGGVVLVIFLGDKPVGIELPPTVDLIVKETVPGIKGATASSQVKPATLETGLVVQVPPFVNEGDKIRVNTETGEYQSRV